MKKVHVTTAVGLLAVLAVGAGAGETRAAGKPSAAEAQYTLLCQTFNGPTHANDAKLAKEALLKATKLKDWYIVTGDADSSLYYGFYRSFNDPKDSDTARAQGDRKTLQALTDTAGNRPFQYAVFVPIGGTDPVAPAEWDLKNAKGYFSLAIAAYMDSPMRKQYAVDAVKEARKQGIEAYYYHGEHVSEVCIGAWPREAVREQESSGGHTVDPEQPVLVSTTPLPASMRDIRTKDTGQKVKVLAPKVEFLDPTLIAAKQKYPTHSINGEIVVRKYSNEGKQVEQQDPSFLVVIPSKDEVVRQDPELQQKAVELGVRPDVSSAPKRGQGKLKSIGE
jgi:hypothetical protein